MVWFYGFYFACLSFIYFIMVLEHLLAALIYSSLSLLPHLPADSALLLTFN